MTEHEKQMGMAQEVGKLLPETIDKVDHYKDILRADANLLNKLIKRQSNKLILPLKKFREKVELIQIKNGILHKQKIYESYVGRKKRYEGWLDEMAVEVQANFDEVFEEAKEITANLRLIDAIKMYAKNMEERKPTIQEKVEFYLYMKQEIENKKKYGKKR